MAARRFPSTPAGPVAEYSLQPVEVPPVHTRHRRIRTPLPAPESLPLLRRLRAAEPRAMAGQPPIVWDRADGFQVSDRWGNTWIDWSSGVLIANAGHGRAEIREAVARTVERPLLSAYVFPHERRAALAARLQALSPDPEHYAVFVLTTGSEAVEAAIKLAKTYGLRAHGPDKRVVVSFHNAFHGRTMGAQLAGGIAAQHEWLAGEGATFVRVPFPDGFKNPDTSFDAFPAALAKAGVEPGRIAAILTESYQGVGPDFMPDDYAQALCAYAAQHDIVTIFDEVQSGFGRTGRMFAFEHYGVTPDLITCGKGITSSLPLAAVIGRRDIMDLYPPGSMTSTHSGYPAGVAAALANLDLIERENLVERAQALGVTLMAELTRIVRPYAPALACLHGRGLVAGIQVMEPGTRTPDAATAAAITQACFRKGLLLFAPVGVAGECVKIAPPLVITEPALRESLAVFREACAEVLEGRRPAPESPGR